MKRGTAIAMLLGLCLPAAARAGELFDAKALAFLDRIDARRLALLPVQYKGRIGILDTFGRAMVGHACGDEWVDGVPPAVAMLELYFNAGAYLRKPVLYVRERSMRRFVAEQLHGKTREQFERTHRLPPGLLANDEAVLALLRAGRATPRQCLVAAEPSELSHALADVTDRPALRLPIERLNDRFPSFLATGRYRPVPLDAGKTWATAEEVLVFDVPLPGGRMPTGLVLRYRLFGPMLEAHRKGQPEEVAELAGMIRDMLRQIEGVRRRRAAATQPADDPNAKYLALYNDFVALRDAWRAREADKVNRIVARLEERLIAARAEVPSPTARKLERLYNQTYSGTIVWIGFAAATVLFIVAAAVPGQRAWWWSAMAVLSVSTAAIVAGFVVRWVLSGRAWYLPPIMNQFEAVVGSAMLAAVFALVLEIVWKKSYFALSAAFYATVSLLCGRFLPEEMGAAIKAQHGILASPVMAVHVSVIIIGHALVGMTFVISAAYLLAIWVQWVRDELRELPWAVRIAAFGAVALACLVVRLLLLLEPVPALGELHWGLRLGIVVGILAAEVVLTLPTALLGIRKICIPLLGPSVRTGSPAHSAALAFTLMIMGFAIVVILIAPFVLIGPVQLAYQVFARRPSAPSTGPDLCGGAREGTLASIDRCNLIVAQLACWTVALGTILGAYWADFAWARWWGWDRKETWALITAVVYILIVHVRFLTPRRWRGLVTALGCILGCAAMLFNWIYVNYYMSGMHSYA